MPKQNAKPSVVPKDKPKLIQSKPALSISRQNPKVLLETYAPQEVIKCKKTSLEKISINEETSLVVVDPTIKRPLEEEVIEQVSSDRSAEAVFTIKPNGQTDKSAKNQVKPAPLHIAPFQKEETIVAIPHTVTKLDAKKIVKMPVIIPKEVPSIDSKARPIKVQKPTHHNNEISVSLVDQVSEELNNVEPSSIYNSSIEPLRIVESVLLPEPTEFEVSLQLSVQEDIELSEGAEIENTNAVPVVRVSSFDPILETAEKQLGQTRQEVVELFYVVEQRIVELESDRIPEVEVLLNKVITILAEPTALDSNIEHDDGTENIAVTSEEKLTVVVAEFFELLGIEVDEQQVKRIVQMLFAQKEAFSQLQKEKTVDRGTHEILNSITVLVNTVKQVLEPLYTLLGRMVLASAN